MALTSKGIYIVGAKRTPFCKYGGSLRELPASHAFAAAAKGALLSANMDPALIDATIVGNVNFLSQSDGGKTARYCGLYSGVPIAKPALTVNKACGTGLQSIINGALEIATGLAHITLTGGTEIMSSLPLLVRNTRFGTTLGAAYQVEEYITRQALDTYTGLTLPEVAEGLANKYGVTREEVDEFAVKSHLKWKSAQDSGIFKREITPLTVNFKKQEITVHKDELPNATVTMDDLSKLPPVVQNGSVVTSGNSAAPADGAAAIILASEDSIKLHNLTPIARVVGWTTVGVDPRESGVAAAVSAVRTLCRATGNKYPHVDLYEINETFAAQTLITSKELGVDGKTLNTHGGALALGHPVAATGARMATHLVYELGRQNLKIAVAASSCGGGQGVAIMLERISN